MVERRKIGLIYSYNENWIAGTYYIENIINALNLLQNEKLPILYIISSKKDFKLLNESLFYPYLVFVDCHYSYSLFERIINTTYRLIFGRNLFEKRPISSSNTSFYSSKIDKILLRMFSVFGFHFKHSVLPIEYLFPICYFNDYNLELFDNKVYWIPDFQEEYLPDFFTKEMICQRRKNNTNISKSNSRLVLSSKCAFTDFHKFYEPLKDFKISVIPFRVSTVSLTGVSKSYLLEKFTIDGNFFLAPNQFWIHKNQKVILEAAKILVNRGMKDITFVFTGKPHDPRAPSYYEELKSLILEYDLTTIVKFIGFVSREELVGLIKNSAAVIQPSLFEGWSTVVEDSRALNKPIILSDIDVHREQLPDYPYFFNPRSPEELCDLILEFTSSKISSWNYHPEYSILQKEFATNFLSINCKLD